MRRYRDVRFADDGLTLTEWKSLEPRRNDLFETAWYSQGRLAKRKREMNIVLDDVVRIETVCRMLADQLYKDKAKIRKRDYEIAMEHINNMLKYCVPAKDLLRKLVQMPHD